MDDRDTRVQQMYHDLVLGWGADPALSAALKEHLDRDNKWLARQSDTTLTIWKSLVYARIAAPTGSIDAAALIEIDDDQNVMVHVTIGDDIRNAAYKMARTIDSIVTATGGKFAGRLTAVVGPDCENCPFGCSRS